VKFVYQRFEPLGQRFLALGAVRFDALHDFLEVAHRGLEAWNQHPTAPLEVAPRRMLGVAHREL
jgi:hypothetical protein